MPSKVKLFLTKQHRWPFKRIDLVAYAEDKGIESSPEKIRVSKDKIKTLFKAFVGRNVLEEKGFYPIYHQIDTTFKRAVYELEQM